MKKLFFLKLLSYVWTRPYLYGVNFNLKLKLIVKVEEPCSKAFENMGDEFVKISIGSWP